MNNIINISNKKLAFNGILIATATVFFYSIMVLIYVIIRTSSSIYKIMPSGIRMSILLQNGISVAYSISVFSVLMAIISSVVGVIIALILNKTLLYFNPKFKNEKAILISFITALIVLIIIYFMLFAILKDWMTFNYSDTFLFWFIFPATIFLAVCIICGTKLNRILSIISNRNKK